MPPKSLTPLHPHAEHRHFNATFKKPGRDLGMLVVLTHVLSDCVNNIGVMIAAVVIWKTDYEGRFYADPGAGLGIAIMILLSSIPLVRNSGTILLQSAPRGVKLEDVKHDLEKAGGRMAVPRNSGDGADIYHAHVDRGDRVSPRAPYLAPRPEESHRVGPCCRVG